MATSDEAQRDRALDPTQSFIVEAPAGSGKTGLLVQRYLRLLSAVERPESIVAMTFTIKAAAEMQERVVEALEKARTGDGASSEYEAKTWRLAQAALENDRRLGWHLLDGASPFRIQTIDALCSALTRQMPFMSNLGGTPAVAEDATELYREAARSTLQRLTEGESDERSLFERVALHFDNDLLRIEKQVACMLGQREQWQDLVASEVEDNKVMDFIALLAIAEKQLVDVFRQRKQVDFTAITRAAIEALGTPEQPTDLLYSLDYRIQHLLVDEFQDTSQSQYRLLKALTEQWSDGDGRTLFLVGDPMQSIYSFREAEVELFLQCQQRQQLGDVRLTPLYLTANFRTTPEILSWVQSALSPVMPIDDLDLGAVKLRMAESQRPGGNEAAKLHAFIEDKGNVREAKRVAEIAQSALKRGSVAILLKNRDYQIPFVKALRAAGVKYEAVEMDRLSDQQHIIDMFSLTRAITHVADRTAWLACLRAPWCGLSLADLAALCEGEPQRTVLQLLSDPKKIAAMASGQRSRAVRAQEVLHGAVSAAGRCMLRDLVERTWMQLGGPAVLSELNHRDDVQTFLDRLEEEEEGGTIRDFSLFNERLKNLYAKPFTGENSVEILTMHGAKGLEFDTVILPRLDGSLATPDRDLLIWTRHVAEEGDPFFKAAALPGSGDKDTPAQEHYNKIYKKLGAKQRNESTRLFYVAMTRARSELHLLGATGGAKRKAYSKVKANSLFGMIWPAVEAAFEQAGKEGLALAVEAEPKVTENQLRRLPANWQMPRLEKSVEWQVDVETAVPSVRQPRYRWATNAARHVGTVVHSYLHRIGRDGLPHWNEIRLTEAQATVRSELRRLGVSAEEEAGATDQVIAALSKTLASERGRWIFAAHREQHSEWTLGGHVGNRILAATVDRTFRDESGCRWIIDFKTSSHEGSDLNAFLDAEQLRYRQQLDSYGALLSYQNNETIRLGLYFPLLDAWREWQFERGLAQPAYTGSAWRRN